MISKTSSRVRMLVGWRHSDMFYQPLKHPVSGGGEHEGGCCIDVGGRGRWQIGLESRLDGEWNSGGRELVRMRKRYVSS